MSASPAIGMKQIPGSDVVTYCAKANPAKKDSVDTYIVYIAEILTAENTVVIRPLSPMNKESITKKQTIKDSQNLTSIEFRTEGVFLRLHPDLKLGSIKNSMLEIEFLEKRTPIGKIEDCFPLPNYSLLQDVYESYYQNTLEAARKKLAAQKQPQATSTGY